jgi:hypothetical protein
VRAEHNFSQRTSRNLLVSLMHYSPPKMTSFNTRKAPRSVPEYVATLALFTYIAGFSRHSRHHGAHLQSGCRGLGAAGPIHHVSAFPAEHREVLACVQQPVHLHVPVERHRGTIAILLSLPGVRS